MYWKLFILTVVLNSFLLGQELSSKENSPLTKDLAEMDSISPEDLAIFDTIQLENAEMMHLHLENEMEKKYYLWLRKRVRDVWPYVKVAVEEYNAIQDTSQYFSKREKRQYIKERQGVLADQFENKLKDLSLSRGQILIKLIHKETDRTSFEIIKELRGGLNAFLWNSAGGAFDLDLKSKFDPHKTREDLYIQVILEKDFRSGRLERIKDSD
ncbi:DUF4294 domain-containing protein [Moheibacter lacus]|uniref:DUF4294 domain-containing protein n=1 Tax=Moheibacter lacus TaxID=2745851 RepID=A0A838ZTU8_9FLAO|nr:DUF4294 domain-containing protein [Moheibacter lacus]MBA5630420.1 DUF4294 domain-containing protein [Moheibacter lacus]